MAVVAEAVAAATETWHETPSAERVRATAAAAEAEAKAPRAGKAEAAAEAAAAMRDVCSGEKYLSAAMTA